MVSCLFTEHPSIKLFGIMGLPFYTNVYIKAMFIKILFGFNTLESRTYAGNTFQEYGIGEITYRGVEILNLDTFEKYAL